MYTKVYNTAHKCVNPQVNAIEEENSYLLEVAVPGYDKKDIKLRVDSNRLIISSDSEQKAGDEYLRREFSTGKFERSFELPEGIVSENISASYENGILSVLIPKKEKVEIKIHDVAIAN